MNKKQPKRYRITFITNGLNNGYTEYTIKVEDKLEESKWYIKSRYKAMYTLSKIIKKSYKEVLPKFPGKKYFGNMKPDFITIR